MSIIRIILFLGIVLLASCQSENQQMKFITGDLVFVSYIKSELSQAINDVTQESDTYPYTHMGIVEIEKDTTFIIHASPENGVERIPIQRLICSKDTQNVKYHVYRLDLKNIDYNKVIAQAKKYIGLPYNWSYELSDTSQYCSELVFNAFEGYDIFTVEPMTFKNKNSDEFNPIWVEYFAKRNQEIPEGALGCNPNGLSRQKNLKLIFEATCIGADSIELYNIKKVQLN